MNDPICRDGRLASRLAMSVFVLLTLAAALGLCDYPGRTLLGAVFLGSGMDRFVALNSAGILLSAIFWGSRPSLSMQRSVLLAWPLSWAALWFALGDIFQPFHPFHLAASLAIPCLAALIWRVSLCHRAGREDLVGLRLRSLLLLLLFSLMSSGPALQLSAALHPATYDVYALAFDRAAGFTGLGEFARWVDREPLASVLLHDVYLFTPLGLLATAIMQLRGRPAHLPSMALVWTLMTLCAVTAYHFFPITGPRYLFGWPDFMSALGRPWELDRPVVGPFPRNGMPSMHFGWLFASCVVLWQTSKAVWLRVLSAVVTVGVAMATIALGEHYLVDLVVAVPFVLGSLALCTLDVPWASVAKRACVLAGFGTWIAWIVLLRSGMEWILDLPWLAWVPLSLTGLVTWRQLQWMQHFKRDVGAVVPVAPALPVPVGQRQFGLMFFVSGAAALVYQVVFAKKLALVFGSTATASFTVLATFLGGMAIGSMLGAAWAKRTNRPLSTYAVIELAMAVYCLCSPLLFDMAQAVYVEMAQGLSPDAPGLMTLRVVLGGMVLLVPTVLMGATLPMLTHALGNQAGPMGHRVAWLYFSNTAGAALGALLTAYFVIPAVGVQRTVMVAALLNLLVALAATELAKHRPSEAEAASVGIGERSDAPYATRSVLAGFLALGMCGVLSLGLEVVYVHLLAISAGNSVYAFGLMVATFLVGLSLGGELARRVLGHVATEAALAFAIFALACAVALPLPAWSSIPDYFASYAQYPAGKTFASREAIRALVCAAVMVPPTLCIGAAYVFAMDLVTRGASLSRLGAAAAINTVGNIAGVLLFGFALVPAIGGLGATKVVAGGAALLGLGVALLCIRHAAQKGLWAFGVLAVACVSFQADRKLDYDALSGGANVYFAPQAWGKVIDHAESIDGGLTSVTLREDSEGQLKTLLTNGKFQGNNWLQGEMQAQIGFAMAPLLHQERRDRALVIGYGTGATSRVFHEAGFAQLDIAELSADVVRMADRHFPAINKQVSGAPGVNLHLTDGRNLLLLSRHRYDVISIEVTSIWFAGAASLYNREFYALAKARMQDDGVLQQWVHLHHLEPMDVLSVLASVRAEFKYVSLYLHGGQGVIVASNASGRAAPRADAVDRLEHSVSLAEVRRIVSSPIAGLAASRLLDAAGIDRYLQSWVLPPEYWASTDDNMFLEYSTPKANANDAKSSFEQNIGILSRFR